MLYVPEIPENVREHTKYHDKIVNGLRACPVKSDCVIWSQADMRITVVNRLSPLAQRRRAEEVASLARRDTHYLPSSLFNGNNTHAFVLYKRNRSIGFLAIEKREHVWETCWADFQTARKPKEIFGHPAIWTIFIVWILKRYRGSHLGQTMIRKSLPYLGCDLETVGWYTPFTNSGEALIRRCCSETFYIAK